MGCRGAGYGVPYRVWASPMGYGGSLGGSLWGLGISRGFPYRGYGVPSGVGVFPRVKGSYRTWGAAPSYDCMWGPPQPPDPHKDPAPQNPYGLPPPQ